MDYGHLCPVSSKVCIPTPEHHIEPRLPPRKAKVGTDIEYRFTRVELCKPWVSFCYALGRESPLSRIICMHLDGSSNLKSESHFVLIYYQNLNVSTTNHQVLTFESTTCLAPRPRPQAPFEFPTRKDRLDQTSHVPLVLVHDGPRQV